MASGLSGAGERAQDSGRSTLTDADITRGYLERRDAVLAASVARIDPNPAKGGSLMDVAVALQLGQKRAAALARLAKLNEPMPTAAMFWMYPMVTVMMAGHDGLDAASWS